ncbi:MAG: DNA primase [Eubacteriales bacterium]|nr:DNA primase [Eubacteriales bacterium]
MISKQVIDDILARTDIQGLISPYVTLKRTGSNLSGLCPFHSEKTPSFTVYPSDNSFYCFGCGVGGNAITFVKKIENLDFEDAVEFLAKRVGVTVTREGDLSYEVKRYDKKRFYAMNADAARFFNRELYKNTTGSRRALEYLTEKRQLSDATIKHFGLGYAPEGFGALAEHLRSLGYTEEEMTVGYLCGKTKNGNLFDYFRGRVMFPIIDVSGNVIAFGGRVLDDSKPKYINSSDTPVFNKKRNLFALNYARHTCTESLILCEGYMDVIALHAADFTNAVATLGTAITPEQARLMKRYTKKVIISYDSDTAGRTAADKATRLLEEAGVEVKLLKMPTESGAKDPDEYIRKYGKDKFKAVLDESRTKFNYYFERSLSLHDISIISEKIKVLGEMCDLISGYYSAAERDVYITAVADRLGVDKSSVEADVRKKIYRDAKENRQKISEAERNRFLGIGDKVNVDYAKAPAIAKIEENVLGLLLLYENHRKRVFEKKSPKLSQDDFFTEFAKKVFGFMESNYDSDDFDMLDSFFTPEEVGRITKIKRDRMILTDNGDDEFDNCVATLKSMLEKKRAESQRITKNGLDDYLAELRKSKTTKAD